MVADDEAWMGIALAEAQRCLEHGDVPVGAVLLGPAGDEIGRGRNERERLGDPTAHAELLALRAGARRNPGWRLEGCTLVVTLEPCAMCAGAAVQARIRRLVFGADDPKAGAVTSLWDIVRDPRQAHRLEVRRGVAADRSAALLERFFADRRGATLPTGVGGPTRGPGPRRRGQAI